MTVRALGLRSAPWNRARRRWDDRTPSAVGRIYHDAWTQLLLRASYHVRPAVRCRRNDRLLRLGSHRPRTHKWGIEFKTQEEVVFIRGDLEPMTDWFARPVLHVTDVDASIRFYVGRLGFSSPW